MLVRTGSAAETRAVGAALARSLPKGSTISVEGPLGVGKTELIRGFCEGSGALDPVTSPSYTILNEYETEHGHRVLHVDAFRLSGATEFEDLDLEERRDRRGFALVEWGDRVLAALPDSTVRVRLAPDPEGEERRIITVVVPADVELAVPVVGGEPAR